ncbi:MAG TPA: pyridoxal-dependent decarboxylase [Jatrophihabitans sp.]|jgi:L-2,4-diaminobutyrate decarboxylase|uniref:pyridoxal phosphate-dependent decarboxylase family protein n=1 Tax=Jatrophihabitans sp. TaxID=1932789 RepID=UPI002F13AD13
MTVVSTKTASFQPVGTVTGLEELRGLVNAAIDVLQDVAMRRTGPVAPGGPVAARTAAAAALPSCLLPSDADARTPFTDMIRAYAQWSVDLSHPAALARMQCPPAPVAVAAELVVAALNQSLHAWESGPFALELDRWVIEELAAVVGYSDQAGGTITAGGSISNLMAVLVARDNTLRAQLGLTAFQDGLATLKKRPVVLCSPATHFSIGRGVGITGIGEQHILRAPTDTVGRLIPSGVDRMLAELPEDQLPVMVIACAGATDLGWVDDLPALAEVARKHGVWLHADAAYGGGALFSDDLRGMLEGIAQADSVTLDLHKFGWTPASSAVFLVRDARTLDAMDQASTTLNAGDDKAAGFVGRYSTSVQATRRVNALKIATTMQALGRDGMAAMVDECHFLARHAASRLDEAPGVELASRPPLSTVVFRFTPPPGVDADDFNGKLRRELMTSGKALLARTSVPQENGASPVFLKMMLLNPATTVEELDTVIDEVLRFAASRQGVTDGP